MADIFAIAQAVEIAADFESGETQKTVLQLVAAAHHRVKIKEWSVSFDGESNTAPPANVKLVRQTSAGTMSALTPEKLNEADDETLQTTAQYDATVEPTTGNEVMGEEVHLQGGYTWQAPPGAEIIVKGGNRIGLVVLTDEEVNCKARFVFEE